MVIMKIPILYLCWVVYWAIKSEPRPDQPAVRVADSDDSDPTRWRPIAVSNQIDDPRDLAAGQALIIPSVPYTDPTTGEVIQ